MNPSVLKSCSNFPRYIKYPQWRMLGCMRLVDLYNQAIGYNNPKRVEGTSTIIPFKFNTLLLLPDYIHDT